MTGSIYALTEPATGQIRYIGQTTTSLKTRLDGHRSAGTPRVSEWVESLAQRGEQPGIIELESGVPSARLNAVERAYIEANASTDLLNVMYNPHVAPAVRVKPENGFSEDDPIPFTKVRRMFGGVIQQVRDGATVFMSEHGHTIAVIVPIHEYRSLLAFRDDHPDA